jgi:hypothetical protein
MYSGRDRSGVSRVRDLGQRLKHPGAHAGLPRGDRVRDQVADRNHQPEVVHLLGEELDDVAVAVSSGDRVRDVSQAAEQLVPLQPAADQDLRLGRQHLHLAGEPLVGGAGQPAVAAGHGHGSGSYWSMASG